MVARRYEFYFQVAQQYLWTSTANMFQPLCNVLFFIRQKDINKIKEGNYRNHVIDKLICEIMENKPLRSQV